MKTKAIEEYPSLFSPDFKTDIIRISNLKEDKFIRLENVISNIKDYDDYTETSTWVKAAKILDEPVEDVVKFPAPIKHLASSAYDMEVSLSDLLSDLVEYDIIPESQIEIFTSITTPVLKMLRAAYEKAPPSIPLKKLASIKTNCTLVTEFDKSFSTTKDTPDNYKPEVIRVHPIATLKLSFTDESIEPVGVRLTEKDLSTLTKWLQLAQVQMSTLADFAKTKDLPIIRNQGDS